jgi:hypothetical protein
MKRRLSADAAGAASSRPERRKERIAIPSTRVLGRRISPKG